MTSKIKKNQTQERHIPSDPNQKGVLIVIEILNGEIVKTFINDITYADALEKGASYEAFKFIPFGVEIKLPDQTKIILTIETFKD